jgi:hypothetical protein
MLVVRAPSPFAGEGGSAKPRRMRGRCELAGWPNTVLAGSARRTLIRPCRATFSREGRREEASRLPTRTQTPDRPKAAGFRIIAPESGCAESGGARTKAACRCRVSMSRCRYSADLAPPGSARGCFGRRGRSPLTRGLTAARPPGAPARDGDASRNPPPHPAARCLATAPLVGCSAGRIGAGGAAGIKGGGYARFATLRNDSVELAQSQGPELAPALTPRSPPWSLARACR